jgi:hypothetical protein
MARLYLAPESISMSMTANPPRWAENLLRAFLRPGDFESVSGDLLEQYRDSIYPARGQGHADIWYITQVFTFVSPGARLFAALFSVQFLARTALDWFLPPLEFHTRSIVSTALGVGILLVAGFWAAWRSDALAAGALAGVLTAGLASVTSIAGAVALLAIWHDPQTMAAIRGSGGFEEVLSLPLMMLLPGVLLGACGGVASATLKRLLLVLNPR